LIIITGGIRNSFKTHGCEEGEPPFHLLFLSPAPSTAESGVVSLEISAFGGKEPLLSSWIGKNRTGVLK
jgi:hypothetical protein